jgi:Raf kinase inhibitor-like YbhB/YbcL family protein
MSLIDRAQRLAGQLLRSIQAGSQTLATADQPEATRLDVTTTSFVPDGPIPSRHDGRHNVSPALAWSGVPDRTEEVVLLVEDPDAPLPQAFVHWSVYGIPPRVTALPEGIGSKSSLPEGAHEGANSTGNTGFFGPKPPKGHGVHHYHFQVFAVDAPLHLAAGADRNAVVEAMRGHVLAQGAVVGTYENR